MHQVDHSENIISVDHVSFAYGDRVILDDINLSIHRGDYLGIVGENGSGKTTLIKIILDLQRPTSGTVKLFGKDIAGFKEWHRIGYVPQKVTSIDANFPATVEEVALMGRFARRGLFHNITDDDKEKVREALSNVDMWQHHDRLIGDLSGGQQQRVFIARALAGEPEVMFLDEPTVGIEQDIKRDFYALLRKLNDDLDLTVVLVTHDTESMTEEAMHIACVDKTLYFHDSINDYLKETHGIRHEHT